MPEDRTTIRELLELVGEGAAKHHRDVDRQVRAALAELLRNQLANGGAWSNSALPLREACALRQRAARAVELVWAEQQESPHAVR